MRTNQSLKGEEGKRDFSLELELIFVLFPSCSSSDCDSSSLAGDSRSPGDQVVPISEGGPGLADAAWEGDTGERQHYIIL